MNENKRYIEEDEIDLKELWKTLVKRKNFIFLFTIFVTISSIIYVSLKNPIPVYSGSVMIEIGEVKSKMTNFTNIDNVDNLKNIIKRKYSVSISIPKRTDNLLIIKSLNKNKELIKEDINEVLDFIINRHTSKVKLHDKYIMTKQIGDISISNTPVNKPKKKLIVTVAFVTGLILSIFLVFFLEFIGKKEEEDK